MTVASTVEGAQGVGMAQRHLGAAHKGSLQGIRQRPPGQGGMHLRG
jgi:hypothetical protein